MDMEEDQEIPILLGQSFLKTARALIDGHQGKIDFRLCGMRRKFLYLVIYPKEPIIGL